MRIIEATAQAFSPGVCVTCNSAPRREVGERLLDSGQEIQWYGRVYVCENCVAHAVKLLCPTLAESVAA